MPGRRGHPDVTGERWQAEREGWGSSLRARPTLTHRRAQLGADHSPHPARCLFPWVPLPGPGGGGEAVGREARRALCRPGRFCSVCPASPCSQTEAPLLIRPYLADMTLSEIHVVMTGGYATIAGSLLGAYISFGV